MNRAGQFHFKDLIERFNHFVLLVVLHSVPLTLESCRQTNTEPGDGPASSLA
jgi:hypothetical protein